MLSFLTNKRSYPVFTGMTREPNPELMVDTNKNGQQDPQDVFVSMNFKALQQLSQGESVSGDNVTLYRESSGGSVKPTNMDEVFGLEGKSISKTKLSVSRNGTGTLTVWHENTEGSSWLPRFL